MISEQTKSRVEKIKKAFDLNKINEKIKEIEKSSADPSFWSDHQAASAKMKELASLQEEISEIEELDNLLAADEEDHLIKKLDKLELKTYLSGKYDKNGAIFSIHAGQGGTEAMDWASMLFRMYTRYFQKKDWAFEVVDETQGEEAGIKSVTMTVDGRYAYGFLKNEAGTHRLVRQSPFNADNLRQTSFALVEVLPLVGENADIAINDEDLEWHFFRSAGQGGQNVQKVSTAVRLRHKPTDIVVVCQSQRYQEQNRKSAVELLKAKLWEIEEKKRREEEQRLKGGRTKAAWGTQIRNYVLHPYKLVKDLRTGYEVTNPDSVLDGDLDEFIFRALGKRAEQD